MSRIVILQGILMILTALAPLVQPGRFELNPGLQSIGRIFLLLLAMLGMWVMTLAKRAMRHAFTIHATPKLEGFLVLEFPYSWIRNPMYVGSLMAASSWAGWHSSWLSLICIIGLAVVLRIKIALEEQALLKKYGDPYQEYLRRTGRFLPRL